MRFSLPFYRTPPTPTRGPASASASGSGSGSPQSSQHALIPLPSISRRFNSTPSMTQTHSETSSLGQPPGYNADEFFTLALGSLDAWLHNVTQLQTQVSQLSEKVGQLESIHQLCHATQTNEVHWTRAGGLSLSIQTKLLSVQQKISNMDTLKTEFDISEQRIATIQEKGLLHSLIFVASRFKRLQAIHVEKCYDHLNVLMKPYSPDLPLLSASVPCDLAHTRRLSQWITDENKLEQVRNRQAELQHLESSVNELNALVEDLNGLLQIQDIHIDSVENYAEVTEHQLNEGNRELGEAEHFSKRIQWAKLVSTFIVIFLICGIVGLILAITLTNNNSRKK